MAPANPSTASATGTYNIIVYDSGINGTVSMPGTPVFVALEKIIDEFDHQMTAFLTQYEQYKTNERDSFVDWPRKRRELPPRVIGRERTMVPWSAQEMNRKYRMLTRRR